MKALLFILLNCVITSFVFASEAHTLNSTLTPTPSVDTSQKASGLAHMRSIGGSVSRAIFTRAVVNREPVDNLNRMTNDRQHVYFFSELKGLTGATVMHRWEFNGQVVAIHKFAVGGPRWRVWSSETLMADWLGEWKVSVVDEAGHVISESTFSYASTKAHVARGKE